MDTIDPYSPREVVDAIRLKYKCPPDDPILGVIEIQCALAQAQQAKLEDSSRSLENWLETHKNPAQSALKLWKAAAFGGFLVATIVVFVSWMGLLGPSTPLKGFRITELPQQRHGYKSFEVTGHGEIRAFTKEGRLFLESRP